MQHPPRRFLQRKCERFNPNRWFIPLFSGFQPSKVVQDFFHPHYNPIVNQCFIVSNFNIYIYLPIIGAGFLPFAVCVFHGEASGNSIVASDARDGT